MSPDGFAAIYALALLVALLLWLFQRPAERSRSGRVSELLNGWRWCGPAPLPFVVLKWAFWLCFVGTFVILGTIPATGRKQPDTAHPFGFTTRNGRVHYVAEWYQHVLPIALTLGGGMVLAMAVVAWQNRNKLERYQRRANNELQRTRHGQDGASPLNSVFDGRWRR